MPIVLNRDGVLNVILLHTLSMLPVFICMLDFMYNTKELLSRSNLE